MSPSVQFKRGVTEEKDLRRRKRREGKAKGKTRVCE